jgi:hypothetical protein
LFSGRENAKTTFFFFTTFFFVFLCATPELSLLDTLSSVTLHGVEGGENFDKGGSNGALTSLVVQVEGLGLELRDVGELTFDGDDTGGVLGELILKEGVGDGVGGVEVIEVLNSLFFVREEGVGKGVIFLILLVGGGSLDTFHELFKIGNADDSLALDTSGQEARVDDFDTLDVSDVKGVFVDVSAEGEGERELHLVDDTALKLVGEEFGEGVVTLLADGDELDLLTRLDDGLDVFVGVGVQSTAATTVGGDGDEELDLLGVSGFEESVFVVVLNLEALFGVTHSTIASLGATHSLTVFGKSNHLDGLDDLIELLVTLKLVLVDTEFTRHFI